jgi:ankyrin repeat protein
LSGHLETIKFLSENKAKINFDKENLERILFDHQQNATNEEYGYGANYENIYPVSRKKKLEIIKHIINALDNDENTTSLLEATKRRNLMLVKSILLNDNIDLDVKDMSNALDYAIFDGNLKIAKILLENNAKSNYSLEELNEENKALMGDLKIENIMSNIGFMNMKSFSIKDKIKTIDYVIKNYDNENKNEEVEINI